MPNPTPGQKTSTRRQRTKTVPIIAEGDSWFVIPGVPVFRPYKPPGTVLKAIERISHRRGRKGKRKYKWLSTYNVYGGGGTVRPYPGDTIACMERYEKTHKYINKFLANKKSNVLLFSAGGNDLLDNINKIFYAKKKWEKTKNIINEKQLKASLKKIEAGYKFFIGVCRKNKSVLIAHTYHTPDVSKGDFPVLFCRISYPFMIDLKRMGYNLNNKNDIKLINGGCATIITAFGAMLKKLKEGNPQNNPPFDYVDLTDTEIKIEDNDRSDAIHLSRSGCEKVAKRFINKLNKIPL